jgi:hypothetical protein
MTGAVGWFAAALLAAWLGVAPDTSTSGTSNRQNNASIQTPASHLDPTTTGCPVGTTLRTAGLTGYAEDHAGQQGFKLEVTGKPVSGTPTTGASRESGSSRIQRASPGATERLISTRLPPRSGANSSENAPVAQATDNQVSQMTSENPPQTSDLLPLLGLAGVGSLIAGFFMRR